MKKEVEVKIDKTEKQRKNHKRMVEDMTRRKFPDGKYFECIKN